MTKWQALFEAGDLAWVSLGLLLSLALFATGFLLAYSPRLDDQRSREFWTTLPLYAALATVAWGLWVYTLTFGPSAGTIPAVDPNPKPMISLQEMMTIEDAKNDESDRYGRGGLIGSTEYLMLKNVMPVTSHDGPLFSVRRPNYQIPHILECSVRWSTFLLLLLPLWIIWGRRNSALRVALLTLAWSTLVYAPVAHAVAGDGWLEKLGAIDFSMGLLLLSVACSASFGLESIPRDVESGHSVVRVNSGTLMLWLGLSVHVAVHTFRADGRAAIALFNMVLGSAGGLLTWCFCNSFLWKRKLTDSTGAGILAATAALAPGAGFMTSQSALTLGFAATAISNILTQLWLRHESGTSLRMSITAMGFATVLGLLGVGVFGTSSVAGQRWDGRLITALIEGDPLQLAWQGCAIVAVALWSLIITGILWRIVKFVPQHSEPSEIVATGISVREN